MSTPIPGPSAAPTVQTLRWLLRPISFMEECRRRHGDLFGVRFLGFETPMYMITDPDAIRALYTVREHGLPPGRAVALLPVVGPRSLLVIEGREHLVHRKLMLPPFHGDRMRAYEPVVRETIVSEVERWSTSEPFAFHPRMQAVTLEVILHAVFGVADGERGDRLRDLLGRLLDSSSSVPLQFAVLAARRLGLPDPLDSLEAVVKEVDELLYAEIAERRADPSAAERQDILSLFVSARYEDGSPMPDPDVRDQLVTLLLAGHETTATALAWTADLLVRHPHALARLVSEVDAGEGAYLRAVIAESLRLRPVVPLAGRRLASELRVDGHVLPAGADVTPAIWLTHTRADLYPEPYAFRPERFLDTPPSTYAWIPFGGGIRRCLGAAFAEMEMRVVLEEVLRRRELRAAAGPERVARRNITFSPRHGTRVVAAARSARPVAAPVAA